MNETNTGQAQQALKPEVCPNCQSDDPPIGWQVSGVYDGILYWACGVCDWAWPRLGGNASENAKSAEFVERHNQARDIARRDAH